MKRHEMKIEVYIPTCGTHIDKAMEDAKTLARIQNKQIVWKFNDTLYIQEVPHGGV